MQVKTVKPHVLLGLSGVGRLFTPEVLAAMKNEQVKRPAVFPMSNPTKNCEHTPQYTNPSIPAYTVLFSAVLYSTVLHHLPLKA